VVLLAYEASFILVAKKNYLPFQGSFLDTYNVSKYEHQICYMHFAAHHTHTHTHTHTHVYVEEVPGRYRLAFERPGAISEKQVSAV